MLWSPQKYWDSKIMKHISHERGAVSVLAIVLVLVVVVAVGFAVYNVSKSRNDDTQSVNNSPSPAGSPATNTSPTASPTPASDQELITAAVRGYNAQSTNDTVSGITIVGANAKGNAANPGAPSGYQFIAHKDGSTWKVVYRGQEKPGKALGEQYDLPADWYSTAY
jgi:uncharacterized protein (UPF0333 family)